jgi:two-component system, OmpR family, sensor kinase
VRRLRATAARIAARPSATFDRLPIRTRLAAVSALLTFVILCAFALAVGAITVHRIRADFNRQVTDKANALPSQLRIGFYGLGAGRGVKTEPPLRDLVATAEHAVIRILAPSGGAALAQFPANAPSLGEPSPIVHTVGGYRVVTRAVPLYYGSTDEVFPQRLIVQYGRRVSDTEATVARVELGLLLGVFAGTALALLAGMAIARRAMAPIGQLTAAAEEIARTRDPSRRIPEQHADDEVAELARTLQGMLRELDSARSETEGMLERQRRFVADASHELRTPLTGVLANLELLAETLHGDQGEAARSALRSSQRMRRLVADLLLLARTDVGRVVAREPCDVAQVVVESAGELGPLLSDHEITLELAPAVVDAARDELHRLALNLLENALRHTPPGTQIHVTTETVGDEASLVVEDNGPGVPDELAPTLFERFVRGAGDSGGSFGLGLAIVQAVAQSHGGSVTLERSHGGHGARFVVRLPAVKVPVAA